MDLRKAMRYRMVRLCDQRRTASEAQPRVKHHICTLDSAHDVAPDERRPPCQGREPRSRGLNLRDCAHSRRVAIRNAVAPGPTFGEFASIDLVTLVAVFEQRVPARIAH